MSNKHTTIRPPHTSPTIVDPNRSTAGISRPAVIPVQRVQPDRKMTANSQNSNTALASPATRPFQLLRTQPITGGRVVQRLSFKSSTGRAIDVSEAEIVEYMHKWIIGKMSNDALTTAPLTTDINLNHLNWPEVYNRGGHVRQIQNSFDAYNILKEAKLSPGYTLALDHGTPGHENQFLSSSLRNNDRKVKGAVDGMLYPSNSLDEDVQGEGVAYKELSMSFSLLADTHGGDAAVAQAHLSLMKGIIPTGYTADEISKMRYYIEVLMLAEGRRNAGMFLFAPIGLQNIADGKITGPQAFSKVEKQKKTVRSVEKDVDVVTKSGNFPSAWVGSKKPLETVEAHFKANKNITDYPMSLKDNKKVLKKMKLQIEKFFSDDNRRDFTKLAITNTPGANFTNKRGALVAIMNLIRDEYFPMIPAFYDNPVADTPDRKNNREKMTHRLGQHQIQHTVHGITDTMPKTETKTEFGNLLPDAQNDAMKLTSDNQDEKKTHRAKIKFARKIKEKKVTKFSDDGSEDELGGDIEMVFDSREKDKQAISEGLEKEKVKVKKSLKRKMGDLIENAKDLHSNEFSEGLIKSTNAFIETEQNVKKFKLDSYQKGVALAEEGVPDTSGLIGYIGSEDIVAEGFLKRTQDLQKEGYFAGLKGNTEFAFKDNMHAKDNFLMGETHREDVKKMALADKEKNGPPKFQLDFKNIIFDVALNNLEVYQNLSGLYYQTFWQQSF